MSSSEHDPEPYLHVRVSYVVAGLTWLVAIGLIVTFTVTESMTFFAWSMFTLAAAVTKSCYALNRSLTMRVLATIQRQPGNYRPPPIHPLRD